MPLPTQRDVRPVDPVLTNLSIGFRNPEFVADELAPAVTVPEKSGTYFIWTRDFWFRRAPGADRAPGGVYRRTGYGVSTGTYDTTEKGYEKATDDPTKASSQTPESLASVDVEFLTNLMQLDIEVRTAAALFVTGIWGTSTTLAGGDQWSDYANSDPIADADLAIRTIRRNTGSKPNKMFIGALVWEKLKEHPLIIAKYQHVQVGIMTPELVAAVLGIDRIVIGESVENTAAEGATFVGADIWTDNIVFLRETPTPGLMIPNAAYRLTWNERNNVPWAVEQYREEQTRSDVARIFTHYTHEVTAAQYAYMYLDGVA